MAPNQVSLTLILLLITQFILISQADANIIDQTCKQTPYYKQCLNFLNSDPKSSTADVKGLALILVDMLKSETTKAVQSLNQIRKQRPNLKTQLYACDSKYDTILTSDIPVAIQALQLGNPKFAEGGLNDAAIEANSCENGFKNGQSPLSKSNKLLIDIAHVASSITRQLL